MTEERVRYNPEIVTPPGETLADLLEEQRMTQTELARRMGRPVKTINEIVHGKAAISPETALQLEKIFEAPADYWLTHEAHYRAYRARLEEDTAFRDWYTWLDSMPIHDLKAVGALPDILNRGKNKNLLLRALLRFFAVATPHEWETVYGKLNVAYRRSEASGHDVSATAVWLRLGELQAASQQVATWDSRQLITLLPQARSLTMLGLDALPALKTLCAQAGVILAITPSISKTRISGASRWINGRPLIQLSLYGKTNDRFWFTFFHELCHIQRHNSRLVYVDSDQDVGRTKEESEADTFAAETLIPNDFAPELAQLRSKEMVIEFANRIGVHPGIVVGRLQHDRTIDPSWMNDLKETFSWVEIAKSPGHR